MYFSHLKPKIQLPSVCLRKAHLMIVYCFLRRVVVLALATVSRLQNSRADVFRRKPRSLRLTRAEYLLFEITALIKSIFYQSEIYKCARLCHLRGKFILSYILTVSCASDLINIVRITFLTTYRRRSHAV